jgi:uncharacterized membrane protein
MKKLIIGILIGLSTLSAHAVFADGDMVEVSGSVVIGVQSTITSTAITEFKDKLEER